MVDKSTPFFSNTPMESDSKRASKIDSQTISISRATSDVNWDWSDWSGVVTLEGLPNVAPLGVDDVGPLAMINVYEHFRVCQSARSQFDTLNRKIETLEICLCGHPQRIHFDNGFCDMGHGQCLCATYRAFVTVSDGRYFLAKSLGQGTSHGLLKGVSSAIKNGVIVNLLVESVACDVEIADHEGSLLPAHVSRAGKVSMNKSAIDNVLLCESCLYRRLHTS